ncbi:MAG: N-acetylneuraminate synthase [Bacteroidetes bacterium HGW-Bacteroidetes-2]|nr:MAG: N-acetylneuraminate synthase [Bacteroidetes bacterium HGW-Bacteroidetes-2]
MAKHYNVPFLIAEIAQAHGGSIEKAHNYIDAIATTGVNAIKFQIHISEAESSIYEPFRIAMQTQDKTRFDYWKRMEFSLEQWKELKKHCVDVGLEFMASPFSNAAVDILEKIGVKRYKIGSGEVNNLLLLQKIVTTKKPIILSSGMSSYDELDTTVAFLRKNKTHFSILQCTTSYPTTPENFGLNVIKELKERYKVPIGFSDHSAKIETGIAAVALGAEILEFHVILNKKETGPDASSSITISQTKSLVKAVKTISKALSNPVHKNNNTQFAELKNIFEKSLAVNKPLQAGHILVFDDLETKKPKGYGMDAFSFKNVLGKKLNKNKNRWDFLTSEDILD